MSLSQSSMKRLASLAQKELKKREASRNHLIPFTEFTKDDFEAAEHHKLIASKLEAVERGDIKRLMIFAPPRHTKSELASRRFPAWFIGKNPKKQIICSTYSGEFAADFGREVRGIVASDEYRKIFPDVKLREDSKAANRWHTSDGGVYVSVGIGGPVTGRGAHLALIDDPLKNRQDADSETIRESIWKWYSSTLRTRLMPGGAIVVILTRWHEDDLAGRLLERSKNDPDGDQWEMLSLPAINDGKALWPQWFPISELRKLKATIDARDWSALYQQNPVPDEGDFFKRDWFKRYRIEDKPETNNYISSDYAVTEDGGDFTEHGVWGVDSADDLYAIDWWYKQTTSDVWIEVLLDLVKQYNPMGVYGEKGVIQRAVEPILNKRSRERKIYGYFEWLTRSTNKASCAQSFRARAKMGKVYIPYGDWGDRLINQLCMFPAGKHDDAVDVCGTIGMALDELMKHREENKEVVPKRRDYKSTRSESGYFASWKS